MAPESGLDVDIGFLFGTNHPSSAGSRPHTRRGCLASSGNGKTILANCPLDRTFHSDDTPIRYLAALTILAIEQDAAAIPQITNSLDLPPAKRRKFEVGAAQIVACGALRLKEVLENASPELIEGVTGMLIYGNAAHRRLGLIYLAEIGANAKSATSEIEKLCHDPDAETRRLATKAMYAVNPRAENATKMYPSYRWTVNLHCCRPTFCTTIRKKSLPVCCMRQTPSCCADSFGNCVCCTSYSRP